MDKYTAAGSTPAERLTSCTDPALRAAIHDPGFPAGRRVGVEAVVAFWRAFLQTPGGTAAVRALLGPFEAVMARAADDPAFADPATHAALLAAAARLLAETEDAHWAGALEAYRGFLTTRRGSWETEAEAFVARTATERPGVAFSGR